LKKAIPDGPALPAGLTFAPLAAYAPSIAVSAGPFTYNGNLHAASGTAFGADHSVLSGDFTFTYYEGTAVRGTSSSSAPTQAGTYTVVAHFNCTDPDYASADSAPLTFDIAQAKLTVTAKTSSKTYGQTVTFSGTEFTTTGLVSRDGITSISLTSAGARASAPVDGSPYAIVASAAVGTGLANYTINYVDGALTVKAAALTITAANQTKIAGESNPAFTVSYSGFVLGQGPGDLGGALTFNTPATTASPPGTYAITPAGLSASNYAVTFVSGTLTVVSSAQATMSLVSQVDTAGLAAGTQQSLDSKLQAALNSIKSGNTTAAISQLTSFENLVQAQSGKKIESALANILLDFAQRLVNVLKKA
jgi:hypothetical protein